MENHTAYHAMTPAETGVELDVVPARGLSSEMVEKRRAKYGYNRLTAVQTKSVLAILADQFKSLLTTLLAAAAGLSFALGDHAEGVAILMVILINVAIGFTAESKAVRSMEALRKMGRALTRVRRNGRVLTVSDEDIVPGDLVLLEAGDLVTADLRLITASKAQCDESLLTGESVPVDKTVETLPQSTPLHDRDNMAFKGTLITRGSGSGIVVATGGDTQLGAIAELAETAEGTMSPLEQRLHALSGQLLIAVLLLSLALMAIGIVSGKDSILMFKTGIALAVAAIPEGLPIVATLALARGMWRLAEHSALIERLSAVETLGSVTVIFTDKTGTLTMNRMTVVELVTAATPGKNSLEAKSAATRRALRVCALCYSGSDPANLADPMEGALVKAAERTAISAQDYARLYPRLEEDAFDPSVRMMATLHQSDTGYLYAVKGAPESIIAASSRIAGPEGDEGDQPFSDSGRQQWLEQTRTLASKGLRILALADKTSLVADDPPYEDLVFLGLVGLSDPARPDAAAAVQAAQNAGIRIIMVTGDNAVTGRNIATTVGISGADGDGVIEGDMIKSDDDMSDSECQQLLETSVFARVNPAQKLKLISLYQKKGDVVAMTGDGVNDAPALKKADVGIAMGMRGTEVAKEAADMILKDDAFASIVMAIRQGRIIFANIRKFVIYLLSCNLSEVMVVSLCIVAGLPLPLMPLQILFLNLVTDVFPALALGFGKGDPAILTRPPRSKREAIMLRRHWHAIIVYASLMTASVVAAFVWALSQPGRGSNYAETVAFLTLAFGQLWHVFNMRSSRASLLENEIVRNPYVWGAIGVCLTLLTAALLWPPAADVLHVRVPDAKAWLVIITASFLPLFAGYFIKLHTKRQLVTK